MFRENKHPPSPRFKEEEFQVLFVSHNFSTVPFDNLSKFSHHETKTDFISVSHSVKAVKYLPLSMTVALLK